MRITGFQQADSRGVYERIDVDARTTKQKRPRSGAVLDSTHAKGVPCWVPVLQSVQRPLEEIPAETGKRIIPEKSPDARPGELATRPGRKDQVDPLDGTWIRSVWIGLI